MATLARSGYTASALGVRLTSTVARVADIASGAQEPRYGEGEALLALWCDAMDKPLVDVPRL
jgi:hypothetical protein